MRPLKKPAAFTFVLVATAMIEELALRTLFTPTGLVVFLAVSLIGLVLIWGPDSRWWPGRRKREYQAIVEEARKILAEKEQADREIAQIRMDTMMLKLMRRIWRA